MELSSLFPKEVYSSLSGQLDALQTLLPDYLNLFKTLASEHRVYIQAGTYPFKHESGEFRNHAYFFTPQGDVDYQEKLTMTRFENEHWHISRGLEIKLFDTGIRQSGDQHLLRQRISTLRAPASRARRDIDIGTELHRHRSRLLPRSHRLPGPRPGKPMLRGASFVGG